MKIRNVTVDDAAAIAAIYNEYVVSTAVSFEMTPLTVEAMRERIAQIAPRFPYFVGEEEGEVAAYCCAHLWRERAAYGHTWEVTLYVAPRYQRRGLGSIMLERLVAACRAAGCHALIACITGSNEASRRLHERHGFRQVSAFREVGHKLGQWHDVTDYELLL